jgi:hypothetical protein
MFKKLLLPAFLCLGFTTFAQTIKYRVIQNEDLDYVLNNIEKTVAFSNPSQTLFVKIYIVDDPSGSAHTPETDEITNTIYIAVSEDGEAPEQHLYKLTSMYAPKIIAWTKSASQPELTLSYGPADKRQKIVVSIGLKALKIKSV